MVHYGYICGSMSSSTNRSEYWLLIACSTCSMILSYSVAIEYSLVYESMTTWYNVKVYVNKIWRWFWFAKAPVKPCNRDIRCNSSCSISRTYSNSSNTTVIPIHASSLPTHSSNQHFTFLPITVFSNLFLLHHSTNVNTTIYLILLIITFPFMQSGIVWHFEWPSSQLPRPLYPPLWGYRPIYQNLLLLTFNIDIHLPTNIPRYLSLILLNLGNQGCMQLRANQRKRRVLIQGPWCISVFGRLLSGEFCILL